MKNSKTTIKIRKGFFMSYTFDIPPHIQSDISNWGFVYLIENLTNEYFYIGKRGLRSSGDARKYKGSSKPLLEDMKKLGLHSFRFEILEYAKDERDLVLKEAKWQIMYDVLNDHRAYNKNILRKFYKAKELKM